MTYRSHEYDPDLLRDVCSRVDLLDYASSTLEFKRSGNDSYAAKCPNHHDINASLVIWPKNNSWYCFGCRKGGDLISYLIEYEHLSFRSAVAKAISLAGMEYIENHQPCFSKKFFRSQVEKTSKKEVQIEREVLDASYMEQFDDDVPQEWIDEGISPDIMKLYGVRIDRKANRIVYPVYDNNGNLIGAKGRTRFKDYQTLGIQKYMNYTKVGTIDYFQGMQQAAKSIAETGEIIIVEGIKSVMKIRGFGMSNVVSSETSRINDAQIKLLIQSRIRNVVIAFDKDVDIKQIRENVKKLKLFANVSIVYDKHDLLQDKMSPCDAGIEVWKQLYEERVY